MGHLTYPKTVLPIYIKYKAPVCRWFIVGYNQIYVGQAVTCLILTNRLALKVLTLLNML